jgi:hypothetical protein
MVDKHKELMIEHEKNRLMKPKARKSRKKENLKEEDQLANGFSHEISK